MSSALLCAEVSEVWVAAMEAGKSLLVRLLSESIIGFVSWIARAIAWVVVCSEATDAVVVCTTLPTTVRPFCVVMRVLSNKARVSSTLCVTTRR